MIGSTRNIVVLASIGWQWMVKQSSFKVISGSSASISSRSTYLPLFHRSLDLSRPQISMVSSRRKEVQKSGLLAAPWNHFCIDHICTKRAVSLGPVGQHGPAPALWTLWGTGRRRMRKDPKHGWLRAAKSITSACIKITRQPGGCLRYLQAQKAST